MTNDASKLPFENLSSVFTDDRQAARCAMDSLIALGHRSFAIVGGEFDEELDCRGVRFSYQDGYDATQALIAED